jgi:flavin reductase (DIM6/NTAB) family NADH-FMN oxidoreductase RutF
VNLLAAGQEALSNRFASKEHEWTRFEGLACERGATGAPLIPGALASLDCQVVALHDAGDHVIVVGRVEAARRADVEPLVYWGGSYRRLAAKG